MEDKNVNKIHLDIVKVKAYRIEVSLKWEEDILTCGEVQMRVTLMDEYGFTFISVVNVIALLFFNSYMKNWKE